MDMPRAGPNPFRCSQRSAVLRSLPQRTRSVCAVSTPSMEDLLIRIGLSLNTVMAGVWIFVLGACVGSFLNVVIYRLPAGLALSHPPSRCPACGTELAARDNIPILGWILLRGRCRYCSEPISPRYPLIETIAGLMFLILFLQETSSGAASLPLVRPLPFRISALDAVLRFGRWELVGWFLLHSFYLMLVLALCMTALDGHRPPAVLTKTGVLLVLVTALTWPGLFPVHLVNPLPDPLRSYWGIRWQTDWLPGRPLMFGVGLSGPMDALVGLLSGCVTGWLASGTVGRTHPEGRLLNSVLILAGVFCGWQMTWPLLALFLFVTAGLAACSASLRRTTLPPLVFAITACLLLYWSRLLNGTTLIRYDGWRWTAASAAVDWACTIGILTALSLILMFILPSYYAESADPSATAETHPTPDRLP